MKRFPEATTRPHQRLWIVSELYHPEETSTGRILTQLAAGLRHSCEVEVLCGQPNYSQRGERAPWKEVRHGVKICRCWATRFDKDRIPCRVVNAITLSFCVFFRLLFCLRKAEQVLVVTTPPTLPLVAAMACWLRGAICSVLVHDVYPDVAVAAGVLKQDGWFTRLFTALMVLPLRASASVIALGRDMHRLLASRLSPDQHHKIVVIPNWAETDAIHPRERGQNKLLDELQLKDKVVVQYSGNMGRAHNIEDIVSCAERMLGNNKLHLLLIGSGAKKEWLRDTVARKKLVNVTVCDELPRERLEELLNACDVAIISFVTGMAGISVPCRTYNILAAGKPIIAIIDSGSELALLIEEERIGWVFAPSDVDGLSRLMTELPHRRSELEEMGRRARSVAERRFEFSTVLEAYRTWLIQGQEHPRTWKKAA